MKRLNRKFRKGIALLLTIAMMAGLVPAMSGGANTVQAATGSATEPSASAYATREQMMNAFVPGEDGTAVNTGKIVLGKKQNGTTAQEWYILGKDTGVSGDNTIIFAASPIATAQLFEDDTQNKTDISLWSDCNYNGGSITEVYSNHYGASDLRVLLKNMASNTTYFTADEQLLMNPTTVTTKDMKNSVTYTTTDKLYALASDGYGPSYTTIKAGSGDSTVLAMNSYWSSGDRFCLRSPCSDSDFSALLAIPDNSVNYFMVNSENAIQPASNLNLTSVLFASAATAASDTAVSGTIVDGKAMTLRLDGSSENIGKAYFSAKTGIIRAEKTGTDNVSLVVQGKGIINGLDCDWYYSKKITGAEILDTSDIKNTLNLTDDIDLSTCKIWLEKTADNGMVYAVEAKDSTSLSSGSHQLFVKTTSGIHITLEVEPTNTIQELKEKISDKKGISSDTQRLIFKGIELKDEYCISDYCIVKDDTLHLLIQSTVEPYIMNIGASHLQGNSGWDKTDGLKIRFGKYDGIVTEYRVLGDTPDTQSVAGETGILLNADQMINNSHMGFSNNGSNDWVSSLPRIYLQQYYNNEDVFSALEKAAIMETTLKVRNEYTVDGNKYIDTESNDYIFLLSAHESKNIYISEEDRANSGHCWLRSGSSTNSSNAATYYGNGQINAWDCFNPYIRVSPAFNIKPSSILFTFHSNVDKSTTNGITNNKYSDALYDNNTWKLTLYDPQKFIKVMDSKNVVLESDNKINIPFDYMTDLDYEVNQVSVMITDKGYEEENSKILYYGKLDTTIEYVYSSESAKEVYGNGTFVLPEELENKKLGEDYHLYMMAEHISENNTTDYSSVPKEITDMVIILDQLDLSVDTPKGGVELDTSVTCDTEGVSVNSVTWIDLDDTSVVPTGEKAGYNKNYSISVNISSDTGYEFTDTVIATILGNDAMSITKNANGTLTVTYDFSSTEKDKLESITAPQAITVANGTFYSDMNLPEQVNIVTEGNTVTSAPVIWDTTAPVSGSYDPSVLTEQTVTLNGTVDCPDSINDNGITLSITIDITISAAGIVGAPTVNPTAGIYTKNQSVTLTSSTEGATIYYTMTSDGTEPTDPTSSDTAYTGAISLTGAEGSDVTYKIKAIAVKDGMIDSGVAIFTYTISIPETTKEEIPEYHIIEGANQSITENYDGTITIKVDGELDKFISVFVDGTIVDSTNYTIKSGSTIVTFTKEYLDTLSVGIHTVRFTYTDGYVETTLTITKVDSQPENEDKDKDKGPVTGDDTPIIWLFVLMLGSGMALYCSSKRKDVKR